MKETYQAPDIKLINFDVDANIMDYTGGDVNSSPEWMYDSLSLEDEMP